MSLGVGYYKRALERALGLLRQGATKEAAKLIEDALALKLSFDAVAGPELELAFDPHAERQLPRCWIEAGELRIDDAGWEIDTGFLEDVVNSIETNLVAGLPEIQLQHEAKQMLKQGVLTGQVRRKK